MNLLVVVVAVLAVLTAFNLFLLLGVIRRLREFGKFEGAGMEPGLPSPGHRVDAFSETTIDGRELTLEQVRAGRALVVFLSPSCQPCQLAATRLAEQPAGSLPPTVVFVHAEPDEPKFAELRTVLAGVGPVATINGHSSAARAFGGVTGYPTSILLQDGVVVAASMVLDETLAAARAELLSR